MKVGASEVKIANGGIESSKKKTVSKPVDFFSNKRMELIKELDEVMREMIWLIRSERPTANKTLFGKVYRALQQARGGKLIEKTKHNCDQYTLEKVSEFQYRVYEHCQKHRAADLLAKMDWSYRKVTFQFQGQNFADVLGLAAALVAPTVECSIAIDDGVKLVGFSCMGFRITRADTVVRFESVLYKKGKDPLMYLKGEVLKNLLPYSDLTVSVPLTGKVKILEKKKAPDRDETTPELKAKIKAQELKQVQTAPTVPAPVDPRLIPTEPRPEGETQSQDPSQLPQRPKPVSPREEEIDGQQTVPQNNDLRKNSDPDVIEIKEPSTR